MQKHIVSILQVMLSTNKSYNLCICRTWVVVLMRFPVLTDIRLVIINRCSLLIQLTADLFSFVTVHMHNILTLGKRKSTRLSTNYVVAYHRTVSMKTEKLTVKIKKHIIWFLRRRSCRLWLGNLPQGRSISHRES